MPNRRQRRLPTPHFKNENHEYSAGSLVAWAGEPVHGSIVGDDPFVAADIPDVRAWRELRHAWPDRRNCGRDRFDQQGILGRAERSDRPAEATCCIRLWYG